MSVTTSALRSTERRTISSALRAIIHQRARVLRALEAADRRATYFEPVLALGRADHLDAILDAALALERDLLS
jgi:hypothetical protein